LQKATEEPSTQKSNAAGATTGKFHSNQTEQLVHFQKTYTFYVNFSYFKRKYTYSEQKTTTKVSFTSYAEKLRASYHRLNRIVTQTVFISLKLSKAINIAALSTNLNFVISFALSI